MIRTSIAITALFTLTTPALADKFHFGSATEAERTEGNAAKDRAIEGVIVAEDDKTYTIRMAGGEIVVAKSQVVRIEKDDLTVATIESMEKDQAVQVAEAETRRREVQAAEASLRREHTERQPEPEATERTLVIEVDFQDLLPGYTFRTFDPVLDRANLSGLRQVIEDFLRTEVRSAAHRADRR